MSKSNVLLIPYYHPQHRAAYISCIAETPPLDAVLLTEEGEYPTKLIYGWQDMNMEWRQNSITIHDQQDLLKTLDWLGEASYCVEQLWSYNREQDFDFATEDLFCTCIEQREEKILAAHAEIDLILDELEHQPLDDSELPF